MIDIAIIIYLIIATLAIIVMLLVWLGILKSYDEVRERDKELAKIREEHSELQRKHDDTRTD